MKTTGILFGLGILVTAIGFGTLSVSAGSDTAATPAAAESSFTEEFMNDPEVFEVGKELWFEQCTHCHGFKAYPGKAPKLKPAKYTPEFVYKRVTKGFRKMPAWEDVYEDDEIRAVVAYIKHKKFSP